MFAAHAFDSAEINDNIGVFVHRVAAFAHQGHRDIVLAARADVIKAGGGFDAGPNQLQV